MIRRSSAWLVGLALLAASLAACSSDELGAHSETSVAAPAGEAADATELRRDPAVTPGSSTTAASLPGTAPPAQRLLFAGDLMIGRRVGELAAVDPSSVFEDVKHVVGDAALALANLESPLTKRVHQSDNPHRLEADPALAGLIAEAGFDALSIANNHAGDAGPESVLDTIASVSDAGMLAIGGGANVDAAWTPQYVDVGGVRLALLAVDVSAQGLAADTNPGIAVWDPERAETAVAQARGSADVVVVSIHGGAPDWPGRDPQLDPAARDLVGWGADIVWGHGPHVPQPVVAIETGDGRAAIAATSLGNFLFDQQNEPQSTGMILEAFVDRDGVVAWRLGRTRSHDLRVHFGEWLIPDGDAVLVDGDWWSTNAAPAQRENAETLLEFAYGDVVATATGDVSGDGGLRVLVSYRHPEREVVGDPRPREVDAEGRTAHIGVFELDGTPVWMSHRPPHAVADLVVCDGAATFAYTEIDDPAVIAVGAGVWNGFGYTLAPELPGGGAIGCIDVDGDGHVEPAVIDR